MSHTYFVFVDNNVIEPKLTHVIINKLTKEEAIKIAKSEYEKGNTTVGIGKYKVNLKGRKMYNMMPLSFYI